MAEKSLLTIFFNKFVRKISCNMRISSSSDKKIYFIVYMCLGNIIA